MSEIFVQPDADFTAVAAESTAATSCLPPPEAVGPELDALTSDIPTAIPVLELPDPIALQPDDLDALAELDANGLTAGAGETFEAYRDRLIYRRQTHDDFEAELSEKGEITVFESVTVRSADRIPNEIIAEAAAITDPLYAFSVRSFPGFFLSRDVGLLWGGCLISDTEIPLSLFLIRSAFRHKPRFLIYGRKELLAHELCHSARQGLHDFYLEEYFAYQTSPSALRRYLGNCFIRQRDALYFTIPALVLLAAQLLQQTLLPKLPVWPFWLLFILFTGWLLLRNQLGRNQVKAAERKLDQFGIRHPMAILFRTTAAERKAIAKMINHAEFSAWVAEKARSEVRWQVIRHRFMTDPVIFPTTGDASR